MQPQEAFQLEQLAQEAALEGTTVTLLEREYPATVSQHHTYVGRGGEVEVALVLRVRFDGWRIDGEVDA